MGIPPPECLDMRAGISDYIVIAISKFYKSEISAIVDKTRHFSLPVVVDLFMKGS